MKYLILIILLFSITFFSACGSDDTPIECEPITTNPFENCCGTAPLEVVLGTGEIFVPNIFTPNGDGNNDLFFPYSNNDITEIKIFTVINNQGQEIFKSFNFPPSLSFDNSWDGRDDQGNALAGLFDFQITVTNNNNEIGTFEGKVCSYPCEAADITLFPGDNVNSCGFPNQHNGEGNFDTFLPNGEASCF